MNAIQEEKAIKVLDNHSLRKTPMRIEILSIFMNQTEVALSNQEIETELSESDRVTLYRTLKTFEKKGIIHQAIDGSGVNKYAMCHSDCSEHKHVDNHAHFHCTDCGKTLCLDEIDTPKVEVPAGYITEASYMVIQGQCSQCS